MRHTLDTFQLLSDWLKELAPQNIQAISVTLSILSRAVAPNLTTTTLVGSLLELSLAKQPCSAPAPR